MEERWTHDKFSTVNRSEEDGARRSPSRNAPDTQRRNINKVCLLNSARETKRDGSQMLNYQPKPRKDEDTTEPLRICLSKVSVSPVVPLAADTAAADCTTSSHQDKPSTAASTANKDTLKEKHQAVVETASNVKTERDPSISVHTETKNSDKTFPVKPEPVVQPPQHSTVKESHQPTPPSLDRTDSDSRRPSSGKNQPPRRRSSNHHLRLSTKQSDLDYGMGAPQSAPVAGYHAYPSGAPTDPLYSPVDGPPPAFIPLNPYGSATYMPMMPGQMLMMTGNGLYIPAQSMYGYYQSGYDGYATSVPPPLVQSTSFDSTYSASTYAPSAPGGTTKSPRAGSKAIPIKAPGSIPPSGAKKSSSPVTLNSPLDKV